ncbi:hypothetical protein, partial [Bradyrhizobium sp.]|uniref:hypothetical protein n=1 Tax=Bradyrhizobium sp. TaxID=376 RepID=UPI0029075AAC
DIRDRTGLDHYVRVTSGRVSADILGRQPWAKRGQRATILKAAMDRWRGIDDVPQFIDDEIRIGRSLRKYIPSNRFSELVTKLVL